MIKNDRAKAAIDLNKLKSQVRAAYCADARFVTFVSPAQLLEVIELAQRATSASSAVLRDALDAIANTGMDARQCMETAQRALNAPALAPIDDERTLFEMTHCGGNKQATRRNEHGDYVLPSVQDAWSGFQTRAAIAHDSAAHTKQPSDTVYVECRECSHCHHVGINDASDTQAACHQCDWTGPSPVQDQCPGCHNTNCMGAACPKCGSLYELKADAEIPGTAGA
jgi:hypothetical protein